MGSISIFNNMDCVEPSRISLFGRSDLRHHLLREINFAIKKALSLLTLLISEKQLDSWRKKAFINYLTRGITGNLTTHCHLLGLFIVANAEMYRVVLISGVLINIENSHQDFV